MNTQQRQFYVQPHHNLLITTDTVLTRHAMLNLQYFPGEQWPGSAPFKFELISSDGEINEISLTPAQAFIPSKRIQNMAAAQQIGAPLTPAQVNQARAKVWASISAAPKWRREQLLVAMSDNPATPLWLYLIAEEAHKQATSKETEKEAALQLAKIQKETALQRYGPLPHQQPISTPETGTERFNRLSRLRNRILACILIAILLVGIIPFLLRPRWDAAAYTVIITFVVALITKPSKIAWPTKSYFFKQK